MEYLDDAILFLKKIFVIVKTWLVEFFTKNALKNAWWLAVAFYLWFGLKGGFFAFWGWACFWIWIGINLQQIVNIFKKLKKERNW